MLNFMVEKYKGICRGVLFVFVISCLGGCVPLRKKFIRQKKKEEQKKAEPVLDPIDYAPVQVSLEKEYKAHYSLWRVWIDDYIDEMGKGESDKKELSLLNESVKQMREMRRLMNASKQQEFDVYLAVFDQVRAEYDKRNALRRFGSLKRDADRAMRAIVNHFKPAVMEGQLTE